MMKIDWEDVLFWGVISATVLVCVFAVVMAVCSDRPVDIGDRGEVPVKILSNSQIPRGLSVYYDRERGVVCWITHFYKAGGISCIPCSQLPAGACY